MDSSEETVPYDQGGRHGLEMRSVGRVGEVGAMARGGLKTLEPGRETGREDERWADGGRG